MLGERAKRSLRSDSRNGKIEEIDMSEKFSNFCGELRTKINDADKRIKDLKANAGVASEKAKVEARAQLAALENKAKEQKARTVATEAKVKAWVEEKKTMTHDKIAQWKEQGDAKRLAARADLSENYAVTAMEIAAAAVDEAERAAVEAVVARMDADGIKAPVASKSA
jgi:membrane protein involved in colicin uptake